MLRRLGAPALACLLVVCPVVLSPWRLWHAIVHVAFKRADGRTQTIDTSVDRVRSIFGLSYPVVCVCIFLRPWVARGVLVGMKDTPLLRVGRRGLEAVPVCTALPTLGSVEGRRAASP
jgi:hypothetical protein